MLFVFFYLMVLPLFVLGLIMVFVFIWNVMRDLEGEEVLDPDVLQSLLRKTKSLTRPKTVTVPPRNVEKSNNSKWFEGHDWSKILDRIPTVMAGDGDEAEQFAMAYFIQFGASEISFPKECAICGEKTSSQILKWKAVHKVPALRGAKTPERVDTNSLWTIVGRCLACDERFILATRNADRVSGDLEWATLQPDNFERLLAFRGKKVSREKLGFVFRTLPNKSLIASGVTGEWIWLKSEYRDYV